MSIDRVRHFRDADIAAVTQLRKRCFRFSAQVDDEALTARLREVFFDNPWASHDFPSLVFETPERGIIGFLGVVPRPVTYKRERMWMAVPTQFMVDPACKGTYAIALTRAFLTGKQDVSYADQCNLATRRLWEHLGFRTLYENSLSWIRPLRPMNVALHSFAGGRLAGVLTRSLRPAAWLLDGALARGAGSPYAVSPSKLDEEDLTAIGLHECMSRHGSRRRLCATYDPASLQWLVKAAGGLAHDGGLRAGAVGAAGSSQRGWYVYRPRARGTAECVAVGGHESLLGETLAALCRRALRDGSTAVEGRVESRLLEELASPPFALARRGPWTVVHSRRPDVLEAMSNGAFALSRLDGEWWMDF